MREKLIELTINAFNEANHTCGSTGCIDCAAFTYPDHGCEGALIANILIANGVTIQKWIPVTERLPKEDTDVLCYRGNHIGDLMDVYTYKGDDEWDDTYGNRQYTEDEGITHWMPLPQPPKGE